MNVIAIEDEALLLDALDLAIRTAEPLATVTRFRDAEDALEAPDAAQADVAFIDVDLPGMNGIDAAKLLEERNPNLNIVFVTGHSTYMKDALDMHASGFISKPVSAEKVRDELDHLRHPVSTDPNAGRKIQVRCFGNFEILVDGEILNCKSRLAIELFAYLIDRRGSRCSVGEIEAVLWEGKPRTPSRQSHLRNLVSEISRSLEAAGFPNMLVRQYGAIGLDASRIECDYWDYLNRKPGCENSFRGEYMTQYSWAERTLGNLIDTMPY